METTMNDIKPKSVLPTRIVTLFTDDSGEYGNASCPHCGADGRYIHYFLCDDGRIHGAMSGCIKLFPHKKTPLSIMAELALDKEKELSELRKKGIVHNLASWFKITIETLDKLRNNEITIDDARQIIGQQYNKRYQWLVSNGYGKFVKY
jgi:hypothetical protein